MRPHPPPALSYWFALSWLALVVLAGILSPWLPLPYPPATPDLLQLAAPPAWAGAGPLHYLGTDPAGRDVLAELLFGARQLVTLSLPAAAAATLLGALAGGAAGFWGNRRLPIPLSGWLLALAAAWWWLALPWWLSASVTLSCILLAIILLNIIRKPNRLAFALPLPLDRLVLSTATLFGALPRLMLVVALAAGPPLGQGQLVALLALAAWPEAARLVRAQMLREQVQPYIEAARAAGVPAGRIWWRHALPPACRPLWVYAPLSIAGLIGLESTLAFLGIGLPPTTPSWGQLLGSLRQEPSAWWLAAGPGLALVLTLLALQQIARHISQKQADKIFGYSEQANVTFERV